MNWRSLKFLFMPSWWIQVHPYSAEWDARLNHLMDHHQFEMLSEYRAQIGGMTVCIANHPFASFTPVNLFPVIMPSKLTRERAMKKLMNDVFERAAK
jgi:hypothetical protein